MSTISIIYDNFKTILSTIYPNKRELTNPIAIERNADQLLTNGYGLSVGNAVNTNRLVGCQLSVSRDFTITITRQVEGINKDTASLDSAEKSLLEDHLLIINEAYKNGQLNFICTKVNYTSDSGIVEIITDQKKFLMIQIILSVEYFETIL